MQVSLSLIVLLLIISALICSMGRSLTPNWRFWTAVQFLVAGVLMWSLSFFRRPIERETLGRPKMDRSSIIASFNSISLEGPQRQLVFHYTLENTTRVTFRINQSACSTVSFRFVENHSGAPTSRPQPNPALSLLEQDRGAYAKFTGLDRLPATQTLTVDQCPLDMQPSQRREVVIAIPYAYHDATNQNPNEDELKMYVRAFMPQIDGFGMSDLARNYEIDFPRGW